MAKKCKIIKTKEPSAPPVREESREEIEKKVRKEIADNIWWKNECLKEVLWELILIIALICFSVMGWSRFADVAHFGNLWSGLGTVAWCAVLLALTGTVIFRLALRLPCMVIEFFEAKKDLENSLDS